MVLLAIHGHFWPPLLIISPSLWLKHVHPGFITCWQVRNNPTITAFVCFQKFPGTFNPLVPNHRKHCPKTFILPTVTYFWKYITKLHLKCLGGQRSWRYLCIIYDTLGIKCSQARVNNSRIKSLLGFTVFVPSIFAFFKKILLENTYCFSLKMSLAGQFSFWAKILPSVSYYDTSNFFHFDGWKNIF